MMTIELQGSLEQLFSVLWVLRIPQRIFAPSLVEFLMKAFMCLLTILQEELFGGPSELHQVGECYMGLADLKIICQYLPEAAISHLFQVSQGISIFEDRSCLSAGPRGQAAWGCPHYPWGSGMIVQENGSHENNLWWCGGSFPTPWPLPCTHQQGQWKACLVKQSGIRAHQADWTSGAWEEWPSFRWSHSCQVPHREETSSSLDEKWFTFSLELGRASDTEILRKSEPRSDPKRKRHWPFYNPRSSNTWVRKPLTSVQ